MTELVQSVTAALWGTELGDASKTAQRALDAVPDGWAKVDGEWIQLSVLMLPVGPCPACGSSEIELALVGGYGRVWICECDRQVPERTLPEEIRKSVVANRLARS